jgi:hypothetical protein
MVQRRRGSGSVPVPIEVLEHQLGIDTPRVVEPDDETPTQPELMVCIVCRGDKFVLRPVEQGVSIHRHVREKCAHCKGTGVEP